MRELLGILMEEQDPVTDLSAEALKYETAEDFAYARQEEWEGRGLRRGWDAPARYIANQLGGYFMARVKIPDQDASSIGDYGSVIEVDGNEIYFRMSLEGDTVYLSNLAVREKGTGLGKKFMEALKDYAEEAGVEVSVYKITNHEFFDSIPWLVSDGLGDKVFKPDNKFFPGPRFREYLRIWNEAHATGEGGVGEE